MTPRYVWVHTADDERRALLVDTRYRETENPGFTDGRTMRAEEALVVTLAGHGVDPHDVGSFDWIPLGRVEDAEAHSRADGPPFSRAYSGRWVIAGPTDPLDGERLYWSNEDGWVDRASASTYSAPSDILPDEAVGWMPAGGPA